MESFFELVVIWIFVVFFWVIELNSRSDTEVLIDETKVQESFFANWEADIQSMKDTADDIEDMELRRLTVQYVESWEDFLLMYLIYKRALDGTI